MKHHVTVLLEAIAGIFAIIGSATFNNVCAGIGALIMGGYYLWKWYKEAGEKHDQIDRHRRRR